MSVTPQEYFDRTVRHLASMRHRAVNDDGRCTYLAPDGSKCTIGCHIPDGHPAQSYPSDVKGLAVVHPDLEGVAWPTGRLDLAIALQVTHDIRANWSSHGFTGWYHLRVDAELFGLNADVIDEVAGR
jgi:hypothetical protein